MTSEVFNEQLYKASYLNDSSNVLATAAIVLNQSIADPSCTSDKDMPTKVDPLLFDVWSPYNKAMKHVQKGLASFSKSEEFIEILTEYKMELKELYKSLKSIESEKTTFRKIVGQLIKKILSWKTEGNFYEDSNVHRLSQRLYSINYEVLSKTRDRLEGVVGRLYQENLGMAKDNEALQRKIKVLQKV